MCLVTINQLKDFQLTVKSNSVSDVRFPGILMMGNSPGKIPRIFISPKLYQEH